MFCSQILFLSVTVAFRTNFLSLANFKSDLSRTNLKLPSSATWPLVSIQVIRYGQDMKHQLSDLESNIFAIIVHLPCFHICKQWVTLFLQTVFLEWKGALFTLIDFCVIIYRRFHSSITADQKWLRERSHESYAKNYSMVFPHDEPLASRNMRCDPFHKVKHLYEMSVLSSNKVRIKWFVGIKCIIGQVLRQAG